MDYFCIPQQKMPLMKKGTQICLCIIILPWKLKRGPKGEIYVQAAPRGQGINRVECFCPKSCTCLKISK